MRYDPATALAALEPSQPFVVGQLGQTLDGKVATPTGKSLYINGECALRHLHRLRASVDAVIVGVGTVIADDPRLTVRLCEGRSPARVILDPNGRVPANRRCLNDGEAETIVITADDTRPRPLSAQLERVVMARGSDGRLDPAQIIAALAERGFSRILVEGGPTTLSGFLEAGAVDALHLMVAPKVFGSGRDGITLPPIDTLDEAMGMTASTYLFDDGDVLFACDLLRGAGRMALPLRAISGGKT